MVVLFSGFGPKPRNKMSAKVDKFDSGENHDRHVSAFEKVLLFTMFSGTQKRKARVFKLYPLLWTIRITERSGIFKFIGQRSMYIN